MNQKVFLVLVVLLAIATFVAGTFWSKIQNLQDSSKSEIQTQPSSAPTQPLSVDNLKKYAAEMGLETKSFNECLAQGQQEQKVKTDLSQGNSLKVSGTPAFFINGRFLGGAFPLEFFTEIIDKELSGKSSNNASDYSSALQEAAKRDSFNPKPVEVKISPEDSIRGSSEAKVTLVEFSDFQCPFCAQAFSTVKKILETYPENVRFVYKQFPLISIHPFAQKAAEASLCAQEQGKFWEYHDKLFQAQGTNQ